MAETPLTPDPSPRGGEESKSGAPWGLGVGVPPLGGLREDRLKPGLQPQTPTGPVSKSGPDLRCASVLVAGAGNIGSHLVPLLVRAGVGLVVIVDRDRVEAKNLANQDFGPEHVGVFKAEALARTVRGRSEGVTVKARTVDLEDLPLDQFRVDLVLGCLDSRRARQALVSERAWPLGVPVVDGGVGEGLVGR